MAAINQSRAGNHFINILIIVLSVSFVLLIAEIGLRLYVYLSIDSVEQEQYVGGAILELLPESSRIYGIKPFLGPPLNTNSLGFRGQEFQFEKSDNSFRIVMLGDSITMGNSVVWNETFSYFLQDELNRLANGPVYEIYNLGVTGYNTSQELATFKEIGLQLNPDLIVLNICINDSDPQKDLRKFSLLNAQPKIERFSDLNLRTVIESSYILTYVKASLLKVISLMPGKAYIFRTINSPEYLINPRIREHSWQKMKDDMQKIHRLAQSHGIDLVAVIYPYSSQLIQDEEDHLPQKDLRKYWESMEVPFLDLMPLYQSTGISMFGENSAVHLSPYGHKQVALALKAFLDAKGLLGSKKPESKMQGYLNNLSRLIREPWADQYQPRFGCAWPVRAV